MSSPEHLAAVVEAEEFAGGPMTAPIPVTTTSRTGHVVVESKENGDWQASCTRCGAGCGAAGTNTADDFDTDALDYEDRMLDDFTAEHRDCHHPIEDGVTLPSPATMPQTAAHQPTVWIVKGSNGSDLRVLAERHTTYARAEGTELRFHDGDGEAAHRVATVRAGAWHWVVAESALNPGLGEQ